jgi:hypothetical protein
MGRTRNTYTVLVGKPEGNRPHGRPRQKCEDTIITYLKNKRRGVCRLDYIVQILYFCTLLIVLFIFENTTFRRLDSVSVFR